MAEMLKLEERLRMLIELKSQTAEFVDDKESLIKIAVSTTGMKLMLIEILQRYIKLHNELVKSPRDSKFFKIQGNIESLEWLIQDIMESLNK